MHAFSSRIVFIAFFLLAGFQYLQAQKTFQVTHIEGSRKINGIQITVLHHGKIAILEDLSYCKGETGPYYFGYSYVDYISEDGGYTFLFDPPAKEIIVNVTGLSSDAENMEEVKFYVNGLHYAIPSAGSKIDCEEMAILTPKGNIRPCRECSISGWKGTKISGPISKFMVTDSVISGQPAGALIALYISEPPLELSITNKIPFRDIAAGYGIKITSKNFDASGITLTDLNGRKLDFYFDRIDFEHIFLSSPQLIKGEYILEISRDGFSEKQKIIVE